MIDILIRRFHYTKNLTLGIITLFNSTNIYFSLEPAWKNNQKNVSCIPEGYYKYEKYLSKKYHRECIKLFNIPNRSYICMHPGNTFEDTHGCILPGISIVGLSLQQVSSSRIALDSIINLCDNSGRLKIIEN